MHFRKDINGLRAIAVIGVIIFHFNPSWLQGGFAGVDVFFVISGYLMTGIIFRGIENRNFSLLSFYLARANRIIPALAVLCIAIIIIGWFILTANEYKAASKHIASSIGFLSNIVYWSEAGYFDASSHEKWLLHTWSLSVEWQFYIIYPVIILSLNKFLKPEKTKIALLIFTALSLAHSVSYTPQNPSFSYYSITTRAWEMLLGGLAFLFPIKMSNIASKISNLIGLALIISCYFLVSEKNPWPGHLAILPAIGTWLIIQVNLEKNWLTDNLLFQKIGTWSYSIYLWHWPAVVFLHFFLLDGIFIYIGIIFSLALGFISNRYIESLKLKKTYSTSLKYLYSKPILIALFTGLISTSIYLADGIPSREPKNIFSELTTVKFNPYRKDCHIDKYREPKNSCEYFGENISWAVFGDSHATEIAYALAKKIEPFKEGIKHLTFSGCPPSYLEKDFSNDCIRWYNSSIEYILSNNKIKNIVYNHSFTRMIFGKNPKEHSEEKIKKMDNLIYLLSSKKDNVYIFYPIPRLPKDIKQLIRRNALIGDNRTIKSTSLSWYRKKNREIIAHFNNSKYPENVHLLNLEDVFCDNTDCFAVKDGISLYFDDNHPSIEAAKRLVNLIEFRN